MRRAALVLSAALAALAMVSEAGDAARRKPRSTAGERRTVLRERELLGARLIVIAEGVDSNHVARTIEKAFAEAARLDLAISSFRTDGELAAVNAAPSQTRIMLSADFCDALARALEIAEETEGAYDPTIGPLSRAWDVRGAGRVPDREEVLDARSRVGWRRVRLDRLNRAVWFQRDSMALDFGSFGRGFALDRFERTLRAAGIERALLTWDRAALAMSDGAGWMVRVAHPAEPRPLVEVAARTGAVSTAAALDRGFRGRDGWYPHALDPGRGAPVTAEASVTVVTRSAARAEALAAALLVMGREAAEAFAAEHTDIGVLWLEPADGLPRGWKWNLPSAAAAPGVTVDWRN